MLPFVSRSKYEEVRRERNAAVEDLSTEHRLRQAAQEANRQLSRALDEETQQREAAERKAKSCHRCQQWELVYKQKSEELSTLKETRQLAKNQWSQERKLLAATEQSNARLQAELTTAKKDSATAREEATEWKQRFEAELAACKKVAEEAKRKLNKERKLFKKTAKENVRLQEDFELSQENEAKLASEVKSLRKDVAQLKEAAEAENENADYKAEVAALKAALALEQRKLEAMGPVVADHKIHTFYEANRQDTMSSTRKDAVAGHLYSRLSTLFPFCELHMVGSTANGCGSSNSDLDVCLLVDPNLDVVGVLHRIANDVRAAPRFYSDISVIRGAKVPIVKLTAHLGEHRIQVDISVNQYHAIFNTLLLRKFAQLDKRFPMMCMVINRWAKVNGIAGAAQNGTFNSYTLYLMVIHFLLHGTDKPVLCGQLVSDLQQLQAQFFNAPASVNDFKQYVERMEVQWTSTNDKPLRVLLKEFFTYYAGFSENDFFTRTVTILDGLLLQREKDFLHYSVCVMDPLENVNCARTVRDKTLTSIVEALESARDQLNKCFDQDILDVLGIGSQE